MICFITWMSIINKLKNIKIEFEGLLMKMLSFENGVESLILPLKVYLER